MGTDFSPFSLRLPEVTKEIVHSSLTIYLCHGQREISENVICNLSSSLHILGMLALVFALSLAEVLSFFLGDPVEWRLEDNLVPCLSFSRLGASLDVALGLSIELWLFNCF